MSTTSDNEPEFSDQELPVDSRPLKKPKLFAPPTNEEMLQIKETSDMFKSNLFKLQIEQLLECNIDYDMNAELKNIKQILDSMQPVEPMSLREFDSTIPPNLKCGFIKPSKISVVGSYLLKTMVKNGAMNVDLAIEMPTALFQEKDHVNNRYFYKRRFYLDCIQKELCKHHYDVAYVASQNDIRRPILVLKSTKKSLMQFSKKGFEIRIIPYIAPTYFNHSKLAPGKNNIRSEGQTCATPQYNNAILQDMLMISHLNLLHSHLQESPALKDAIVLAKVWLQQRGFGDRFSIGFSFNGFIMSMIMAWLLRVKTASGNRKIGNNFSSYQILRITIELLANHDFSKKPMFLTDDGEACSEFFTKESFLTRFDVAIVDPSGTINLAGNITKSAIEELQYEARLSTGFFKEIGTDRFEDLFLKNVHQEWIKYDNVFRIPKIQNNIPSFTEADAVNYISCTQFMVRKLHQILKQGLGDRTLCISVSAPPVPSWKCNEPVPSYPDAENICVGMVLHPENCLRLVEVGPDSEDVEAIKLFKKLWGSKSESRRFQDGSIAESVVFDCDGSLQGRGLLVARMTAYLFDRHFNVGEENGITYWAGLGNKYLKPLGYKQKVIGFQSIMDAFISLTKEIRSLDLPLSINRLVPVSESLRYTCVFVPQPIEAHELVSRSDPAEFLIEFEFSGKWPDDLSAIETMKRAFYIKIAHLIAESDSETSVTVLIGEKNESFLEFTHSSGHIFRARIHHSRVGHILDKTIQTANPVAKIALEAMKKEYLKKYVRTGQHSGLLSNLCLRFPFLGSTIRLVKRWLSSHMLLSNHRDGLSPEVVEIICSRIYTCPTAFGSPSGGWTGFVRVLDLLQSWKWAIEPLIVELEAGKMTASIKEEIDTKFESLASSGSNHIPMYVATELDTESKWWGTLDIPTNVVQRIVVLARSTLNVVKQQLLTGTDNDISQLFITPSDGYHAIIHLDCQKLLKYLTNITFDPINAPKKTSEYKNVTNAADKQLLKLSFIDPLSKYLRDLYTNFGDVAQFFADIHGGDKIAIVWKPLSESTFKKTKLVPNYKAMLADMQRLGGDLIVGIEIQMNID